MGKMPPPADRGRLHLPPACRSRHEGGLRLGLWRNAPHSVADPHSKKQIHELFRKAGTPEWDAAATFALPVAGLKSWDELKKD